MTVQVNFKGPVFDGSAAWILTQGVEQARREVAEQAKEAVFVSTLQFRNPTGRYKSLIHIQHAGFSSKILPGMLPYVRWLEGTSRRNQTTRFKGYKVFEKAFRRIELRVVPLFEKQLEPVIARLNR